MAKVRERDSDDAAARRRKWDIEVVSGTPVEAQEPPANHPGIRQPPAQSRTIREHAKVPALRRVRRGDGKGRREVANANQDVS